MGASLILRMGGAPGHPLPALLLFLAAAAAGMALVVSIFLSDNKRQRRR